MNEKCPNCYALVSFAAKVCHGCGYELRVACPRCGYLNAVNYTDCVSPNCAVKITPLAANEVDPVTLHSPIATLTAHTGTVHASEWKKKISFELGCEDSGFFWPFCGQVTPSMTHAWVEIDDLLCNPNVCGRCKQIVGGKTYVFGGYTFTEFFEILRVCLLLRVGPYISGVRLDEFDLSYDVTLSRSFWKFRGRTGLIGAKFIAKGIEELDSSQTQAGNRDSKALQSFAEDISWKLAPEILK